MGGRYLRRDTYSEKGGRHSAREGGIREKKTHSRREHIFGEGAFRKGMYS